MPWYKYYILLEENSEACGQVIKVIEQQAHDVVKLISRKSKNIEIVTFTLIAQLICNPLIFQMLHLTRFS